MDNKEEDEFDWGPYYAGPATDEEMEELGLDLSRAPYVNNRDLILRQHPIRESLFRGLAEEYEKEKDEFEESVRFELYQSRLQKYREFLRNNQYRTLLNLKVASRAVQQAIDVQMPIVNPANYPVANPDATLDLTGLEGRFTHVWSTDKRTEENALNVDPYYPFAGGFDWYHNHRAVHGNTNVPRLSTRLGPSMATNYHRVYNDQAASRALHGTNSRAVIRDGALSANPDANRVRQKELVDWTVNHYNRNQHRPGVRSLTTMDAQREDSMDQARREAQLRITQLRTQPPRGASALAKQREERDRREESRGRGEVEDPNERREITQMLEEEDDARRARRKRARR